MRKLVFFIPAILFTAFYSFAALAAFGAIHPIAAVWLPCYWVAGALLCKSLFWGGFLGVVPAIHWIYMGTQDTGQIVSESPIGVALLLFYAICIYCVYRQRKA